MIDSFPSTSESRFRAACDRCHELKNRCARRQGTDSRCERCERLELDCVYSTGARMGRPPGPQGKQQRQQTAQNSSAETRSAARPARGRGAAPYQGRRSHGSSASPAGAGKQSRAASPAPKRHRHHHRRRAQSSVVAFGSYNSSNSEPMDLATNGMTPVESASSSSGSGIQGSGILLSPLESGAKSWLDAQDGVAVGASVDWDQEMAALAAEQAHVQWPNKTTAKYNSVFPGILEGLDALPGHQEDTSFLFQEPADRHMIFNEPDPRKQGVDAGSTMSVLKDAGHSDSPTEKLMKLQDELRDLVASQAPCPEKSGQEEPRRRPLGANKSSLVGTEDEEIIQHTLSLHSIIHELLQSPPTSGSGSSSSEEECCGPGAADDIFLHEAFQVRDPAFHAGSSAASQTAMLQVLNCYTYLLQLLDVTASRLECQMENPRHGSAEEARNATGWGQSAPAAGVAPFFQIGCFCTRWCASSSRIHGMIDRLAFGRTFPAARDEGNQQSQASDANGLSRTGEDPAAALVGGTFSSPVIIAARAVMGAVYDKEETLLAKMRAISNGEGPILYSQGDPTSG